MMGGLCGGYEVERDRKYRIRIICSTVGGVEWRVLFCVDVVFNVCGESVSEHFFFEFKASHTGTLAKCHGQFSAGFGIFGWVKRFNYREQ